MSNEDEFGGVDSGGNKTNLSNLSISKIFIGTGYLNSKGAKKSNGKMNSSCGNIEKNVKAVKNYDYLISNAKKTFNHL